MTEENNSAVGGDKRGICAKICYALSCGLLCRPDRVITVSPDPPISAEREKATVLVVGNIDVGKTSLITCMVNKQSTKGMRIERTTTYQQHLVEIDVEGKKLKLDFQDFAGNENAKDLIRKRTKYSYIVLCYAVDKTRSLEDLDREWLDVIDEDDKGKRTPIALVATKVDKR